MAEKLSIGDKAKLFEQAEAGRRLMPKLPLLARIDGKSFHKWTKGLKRPYDPDFRTIMAETTKCLVKETNALCGLMQSDELSLVYYSDSIESQLLFDGKIHKLVSVLASIATAKFNSLVPKYLPAKKDTLALFDCRVWNVPTLEDVSDYIHWRSEDAFKNSVSMAAGEYYSHKELMNKTTSEKIEMLHNKEINFSEYPESFKRGVFLQRRKISRVLTEAELMKIPEKHRPVEGQTVERSEIIEITLPPFLKILNKEDLIFKGADPITATAPKLVVKEFTLSQSEPSESKASNG